MILIHSRLFAQMYDTLDVCFFLFVIHFVQLSRVVYMNPYIFFDSRNMKDLFLQTKT